MPEISVASYTTAWDTILISREIHRERRTAALAEWRAVMG